MRDHIIEVTDTGWTLQHPIACRPNLFACPVNAAAGQLTEAPAKPGRYWCGLNQRGRLVVGGPTDQAGTPTDHLLADIARERQAQDAKWGEQNHPDGTGGSLLAEEAKLARNACQWAARHDAVTWRHVLREEVAEAFAETDPAKLRAELVQVAAVAVAWAETLDRRAGSGGREC